MNEIIAITDGYTLNPGDLSWTQISAFGQLRYFDRTPENEVPGRCVDATIIVTNKTPVTSETISKCPGLKLIAVTATGYNIVDIDAAKKRGVVVSNVPGYGTDSVAQHTFALLLELTNHVGSNSNSVSRGDWFSSPDFCYTVAPLTELADKTLGIIGLGQIGRKVAEIGKAFGMKVIYSRSGGSNDPGALSIEEVFTGSDVVSLHCPLTKTNHGFVNRSLLQRMKSSAILINTSRGQLINESDLAGALKQGVIRGAALDVLSTEPPSPDNPLIGARGCIITPHNAWYSFEARQRIMSETALNVEKFLRGEPRNVVSR
jgi:glycerate dehydrogenase